MDNYDKIKQQVEERLKEQQSSKEFKDIGRVAMTKKELSAFRLINTSLLDELEKDSVIAFNMVKKDTVWIPINREQEIENGVNSGALYLKEKIRASVPKKPADDKLKRASYVMFLEKLQNDLVECKTVDDISKLIDSYRKMSFNDIIGYFIEPTFFSLNELEKERLKQKLKESKNFRIAFLYDSGRLFQILIKDVFGAKFENMIFRWSDSAKTTWIEAREKEPISEEKSKELIQELENRKERFLEANYNKIEAYKNYNTQELNRAMNNEWNITGYWKNEYRNDIEKFRKFAIEYIERKIEREVELIDKRIKDSKPKGSDWSWMEESKKTSSTEPKKEKATPINTKEPLSYIKRTGGYAVESISPKNIIDKFGFSAVNYGNYVDDKWSKEHTKHFLGAISDLGEMLDLNIRQINNLGALAIAFGAKGRAGHLATYFPQTKDINLTKRNGDGSVAHEWGHYFDNVLVDLDLKRGTSVFASETRAANLGELGESFKKLMTFFYNGNPEYTPKVPIRFYPKKSQIAPTYYSRTKGSLTVNIKPTIEETLSDFEELAVISQSIYPTQIRIFGYIISEFGLDYYDIPCSLKTSYFYHKSAYNYFQYCKVDSNGKIRPEVDTRTKYWTSSVELFARAFETVILKRLLDKNRVSNYLVNDINIEDVVFEGNDHPYPSGKELEYIDSLISEIVYHAKVRYNLDSYTPISNIRQDEYVELDKASVNKVKDAVKVDKNFDGDKKIVFESNNKTVKVVEDKPEQNIEQLIAGLELLDQTEDVKIVIDGLKLLL